MSKDNLVLPRYTLRLKDDPYQRRSIADQTYLADIAHDYQKLAAWCAEMAKRGYIYTIEPLFELEPHQ